MIKCCIFDLDGTLLNTLPTITYYINLIFDRYGIERFTLSDCRKYVGNGARNLLTRALADRGVTDPGTVASYITEYLSEYDAAPNHLTEPYPDIRELTEALSSRGILLAVLSNKPESATRPIVEHFFGDKFTLVCGAKDGVPLKPSAEPVYNIFRELSLNADECCYIGDSEVDIKTARNASIKNGITVSWGYRDREDLLRAGASLIVDSPLEILGLLNS